MGPAGERAGSLPKQQWTSVGDSTVVERRVSRKGAKVMGFPDFPRPTFKGRRKVCRGAGAGEECWVGSASSPLSGRPRAPSVTWSGEGLGKVCVCCWQSARWEARAGRRCGSSLLLSGSGWGCTLGAAGRLWRPAPGARRAGGGREGGRRGAGARGARTPSAGIARLAGRAEQARGPGGGALTLEQPELEEEEEARRRGGGEGGGGGESLPPGEHGAPGAQAAVAGAAVAG